MIRGVNKQIIEINNTEDEFFEKVVFYVNPNFINVPIGTIENRAKKFIKNNFNQKIKKLGIKWSFSGNHF